MATSYRLRCPKCNGAFEKTIRGNERIIHCPLCSFIFEIGAGNVISAQHAEEQLAGEELRRRIEQITSPLLDDMKRKIDLDRKSLVLAADALFEQFVNPDVITLNGVEDSLKDTFPHKVADIGETLQEVSIARTKPSKRKQMLSFRNECIAESVLSALDDHSRAFLGRFQGFLMVEMPLFQLRYSAHKVEDHGSLVIIDSSSSLTLSALNYSMLKYLYGLVKHTQEADAYFGNVVRLLWYIERGNIDLFDRAVGPLIDSILNTARENDDGRLLSISVLLADIQTRFLIAHEIAHILSFHMESEDAFEQAGKAKREGEYSFTTLRGTRSSVYLNRDQIQELQADALAAEVCLNQTKRVSENYQLFAERSSNPMMAMAEFERLAGPSSKSNFLDAITLLMLYFVFMDLSRDITLQACISENGLPFREILTKLGLEGPNSHPQAELRLRNFRDHIQLLPDNSKKTSRFFGRSAWIRFSSIFRNKTENTSWTDALFVLTDRLHYRVVAGDTLNEIIAMTLQEISQ